VAVSSITGKVKFDIAISAYGYQFDRRTIDPCEAGSGLDGMCPMRAGNLLLPFALQLDPDTLKSIPGIAYSFPDLDAKVRVLINMTDGDNAGQTAACVEANVSNGKTIDLPGVKWALAAIAILAFLASAVISGLGHVNAASHISSSAVSLFGYFQAQAMLGLTGIHLPPVARAWSQDFQWSMGIIRLGFMQSIFTWYQRATGGTPSTLFDTLTTTSVQVAKRDLSSAPPAFPALPAVISKRSDLFSRAIAMSPKLARRGNIQTGSGSYIVYGIQRVAFVSGIESTNLFMTGITFFGVFVVIVTLLVLLFRLICGLFAKNDAFLDFRNGWKTVLKGILFRMCLIGFPLVSVLCLWEFTQRDSAAEVVLAVFFFFGILFLLSYAAFKIISIARRSINLHRNPAYILFSDPQTLNKWGFLYVPYRASGYYFFAPVLVYVLIKSMFIALAQDKPVVQAVALLLIEAAALITTSVLRPWMDKSTNSFNIAIYAVNFINAILLLIFSNVFDQPPLMTGVVGIILWILNNIFTLVLLLMLIITTTIIFFQKNPDNRYQYMLDDRTSFIKSQTQLGTSAELDALAATARGGGGVDLLEGDDIDALYARGKPGFYEKASTSSAAGSHSSYNEYYHSDPSDGGRPPEHMMHERVYSPQAQITPFRGSSSPNSRPGSAVGRGEEQVEPSANAWQRGAGYEKSG
jgi:hypothetical protein